MVVVFFFFFNDTATTEIYTLSLHDALPIWLNEALLSPTALGRWSRPTISLTKLTLAGWSSANPSAARSDRKSTRLNSSHANISYAVFCLKKKKTTINNFD